MPLVRITTNFELGDKKESLSNEFHRIMVDVAHTIEHARLVVFDEKPGSFFQPYNTSGNYAMVEITFFPGRSLEVKRRLYKDIAELLQRYGAPPENCRIVLIEAPRENWSVRNGLAGCDVDLGFDPSG